MTVAVDLCPNRCYESTLYLHIKIPYIIYNQMPQHQKPQLPCLRSSRTSLCTLGVTVALGRRATTPNVAPYQVLGFDLDRDEVS
jgi:hypothetical protein